MWRAIIDYVLKGHGTQRNKTEELMSVLATEIIPLIHANKLQLVNIKTSSKAETKTTNSKD